VRISRDPRKNFINNCQNLNRERLGGIDLISEGRWPFARSEKHDPQEHPKAETNQLISLKLAQRVQFDIPSQPFAYGGLFGQIGRGLACATSERENGKSWTEALFWTVPHPDFLWQGPHFIPSLPATFSGRRSALIVAIGGFFMKEFSEFGSTVRSKSIRLRELRTARFLSGGEHSNSDHNQWR
jgi:hypothetical protein